MTLGFTYETPGKSPAQFSISERSLKVGSPKEKNLYSPITTGVGLDIKDWQYSNRPEAEREAIISFQKRILLLSCHLAR